MKSQHAFFNRASTKLFRTIGHTATYGLTVLFLTWAGRNAVAGREDGRAAEENVSQVPTLTAVSTPTPTPTPSPSASPGQGIIGEGTFAGPNGRLAEFFILDVENKQETNKYLLGEFGYSDHRSHITFETGKILTATFNGNQAAFTGMATIGGKHKQKVDFTVSVTANQSPPSNDTFNISLSNGYSASGTLTSGEIRIETASD